MASRGHLVYFLEFEVQTSPPSPLLTLLGQFFMGWNRGGKEMERLSGYKCEQVASDHGLGENMGGWLCTLLAHFTCSLCSS